MAGINPTRAEREADLVMGTNSSSIVSKRSVELLYYSKPHYFRYFVRKPQRRAPLVNRGYWLRMHAVAETVRRFMDAPSDKPNDPLPFMLLSAEDSRRKSTRFVDVDYDKLMINKKRTIQRTKEITELLENAEFLPDDQAVQVRSARYVAIGCDLKDLDKLDAALRDEIRPAQSAILCVAEVSLTYMDVMAANAVIRWASTLSHDVQFCLLEQFFPDGPDHPFAATMMKCFNKIRAPLYSIHEYPLLTDQERRFKEAGWKQVQARSLWELWSDDQFLAPALRASLDRVEPFDEWEEFGLFASHYFLLVASNSHKSPAGWEDIPARKAAGGTAESAAATPPLFSAVARPVLSRVQRRFGAAIPNGDTSVFHHGGLGSQSRLTTTDHFSTPCAETPEPAPAMPPRDIAARMCHNVTSFPNGDCLLSGGRASPASVFQDCWLRQQNVWLPAHSLPAARFRHCATRVELGSSSEHVLVFGGKSLDGEILDSWLLWSHDDGWKPLEQTATAPVARFGACLGALPADAPCGILFGGIGSAGTIIEDLWAWTLRQRDSGSYYIELTDETSRLCAASDFFKYVPRFGASLVQLSGHLVLIGGVMPRQVVPADKEIMAIRASELQDLLFRSGAQCRPAPDPIGFGRAFRQNARPLLVGHASCAVGPDRALILGGSACCFTFGTFWNTDAWLLKPAGDDAAENPWTLLVPEHETPGQAAGETTVSLTKRLQHEGTTLELAQVARVRVETAAEFDRLVSQGKPVVIEGLDIGPCTKLWTREYLKTAVGKDKKVVVHEAHSRRMNFQAKNFNYTTTAFGTFLDEVHTGSRQYLRAVSSEQPSRLPANLAEDFPGLKDDFRLPEQLSLADRTAHSSPLRISGPVTMWLHYDVMANVLCQVRGERRLILYPPSDVQRLQIPAGASSSTLDIFSSDPDNSAISAVPETSPHEAKLRPGEILFIPPLWPHTASSPAEQPSVAVNVFFRSLSRGYAAGRDLYGNRDLQAYEKGRNDLQKLVRSFDGLPPDMARFYLLRLAGELQQLALRS